MSDFAFQLTLAGQPFKSASSGKTEAGNPGEEPAEGSPDLCENAGGGVRDRLRPPPDFSTSFLNSHALKTQQESARSAPSSVRRLVMTCVTHVSEHVSRMSPVYTLM